MTAREVLLLLYVGGALLVLGLFTALGWFQKDPGPPRSTWAWPAALLIATTWPLLFLLYGVALVRDAVADRRPRKGSS